MVRGSCLLKRPHVATYALRRQTLAVELAHGPDLVAGVTIHNRMRTDQRETVLMLIDVVNRNLPAIDAMAEIALGAVFSAMQVGVTILALPADIGEHGIDMAFLAEHLGMHAAQGICRLVVIELRILTDGHPCRWRMAILARRFQRAVRVRRRHRRGHNPTVGRAERHLPDQQYRQ
jgi:hypothetical protein